METSRLIQSVVDAAMNIPGVKWLMGDASLESNTGEGHRGGYILGGDRDTYYPLLWDWIIAELEVRTVLDVGCGEGHATAYFKRKGCRVLGIEGSATAIRDSPDPGILVRHDYVGGPYRPDVTYDLAWSCEFVEHVEERYLPNFLETFRHAGRYVFLTHALPGQPGWHHVNCQEPGYWIDKLFSIGFSFDYDLTIEARRKAGHGYFAKTGLVFTRDERIPSIADPPLASVVVCTFNRKRMLLDCLDALLAQTYARFEVVVVDDGSEDDTGQAMKRFSGDARVRYIRQKHAGLASARNLGIRNSEGEMICFIDDDCIADRRWLQNIVGAYSNGDIGGVGGRIINHEPWTTPKTLLERFLHKSGLYQQRYVGEFLVGANSSYRRAALEAVNGFDGSLLKDEDADIGMRIIATGMRFAYAPKAMVYHRTRGGFRGLLAQVYGYGTGHMMVYRKYPSRHSVARQVLRRLGSIVLNAIRTPIRLAGCLWQDDMTLYVMEPLINSAILAAETAGIISELIMPTKPQRT